MPVGAQWTMVPSPLRDIIVSNLAEYRFYETIIAEMRDTIDALSSAHSSATEANDIMRSTVKYWQQHVQLVRSTTQEHLQELRLMISDERRRHMATIQEFNLTVEALRLCVQQKILLHNKIKMKADRRRQRVLRRRLILVPALRRLREQARLYRAIVRNTETFRG